MVAAVLARLAALGYPHEDVPAAEQAFELAADEILALANLDTLPTELLGIVTEYAVHKMLFLKGVTEVKLGEMTLKISDKPPDVARFRRVVW